MVQSAFHSFFSGARAGRYALRRSGEGVYDMDDLAVRTQKMAGFIRAHREAAKASATIGLGYSNGANVLASMLFSAPALIDRAVLMHPLIPFAPPPQPGLKGKAILLTAGRLDPTPLVTHHMKLSDAQEAYDAYASHQALKIVLSA